MTPNEGGKFIHVSVLSSDYCVELKLLLLSLLLFVLLSCFIVTPDCSVGSR